MYTLVPYTSLFLSLRIAEAAVHGEVAESLGERRHALDRKDDAAHTAEAVVAGTDLGLVHARELGFGEPGDIELHAGARGPVQGRGEGVVVRGMSGVDVGVVAAPSPRYAEGRGGNRKLGAFGLK